jgi:hypothetical protein
MLESINDKASSEHRTTLKEQKKIIFGTKAANINAGSIFSGIHS